MFVLPTIIAPAFSKFSTAVAVYGGTKLPRIFEEHVVRIPFVHMLSLIATGTPARGPVSSPASILFCTLSAASNIFFSSITVTNALILDSNLLMLAILSFAASTADVSPDLIFLPSSTAVKSIKFIFQSP